MNRDDILKLLSTYYSHVTDCYDENTYFIYCKFKEDRLKLTDIKCNIRYYIIVYNDKDIFKLGRKIISDINGAIVNKIRFNKSTIEKNLNLILVNDNVKIL